MTIMNHTATDAESSFLGLQLSTHRVALEQHNEALGHKILVDGDFQYEALIAAISIAFFRSTVRFQNEPLILRLFFSTVLAALAYTKKSYELTLAVEMFSYVISWVLLRQKARAVAIARTGKNATTSTKTEHIGLSILFIAGGAAASLIVAHALTTGKLRAFLRIVTPNILTQLLYYLFPITELTKAIGIMREFVTDRAVVDTMIHHLLFTTFHIQCGMGFLGIDFLRKEQSRRNQLIRLDVEHTRDDDGEDARKTNGTEKENKNGKADPKRDSEKLLERSYRFQRGAAPFIIWTAMPYMIQIITYGNINKFAFSCVQDEMHRMVRFNQVFEHENHLVAMSNDTPTSPEAYATSMNTVVSTAYDMLNRKLFSLPKILLLPTVMSRQPMLVAKVFPFIFVSDWLKANAVSYMTTKIETLQKEIQELTSVRSKVESFDMKNAELLQRSGGKRVLHFTQKRWEALTTQVQSRLVISDLLTRTKGFFTFMQRNFVFSVLIDCALAKLIAIGKIATSEVFVFSRAVEDAVDMVLTRSRGEAELARMMTEIDKLKELVNIWENSRKASSHLHCRVQSHIPRKESNTSHKALVVRNLHYTRGTASARADHLELYPGVYALTGANGSGKSTLFRILMSCSTNEKVTDLPSSINMLTPAEPLMEEDDILREKACLEEDEEDETEACENKDSQERELEVTADGETVPVSRDTVTPLVPKLSITMPSSSVVEISQNFYWPLYSKPIDWIFEDHISEIYSEVELEKITRKVAEELHSLQFFQQAQAVAVESGNNESLLDHTSDTTSAAATIERIMSELLEEKEDWFSDLSGGQKSKVELVRTVFLRDTCQDVLLIDETMAPLDPASKELVMAKLKEFCRDSIIIVIYHTDVGQGIEVEGKTVDCVPSNNFFDKNIHLEKGVVHVRETC